MNYEELLEKICNREEITDEEYDFITEVFLNKLRAGEEISSEEISHLLFEYDWVDRIPIEIARHGWVWCRFIIEICPGEYYAIEANYNDDCGIDYIDPQVCPRVEKRKILTEQWIERDKI